MFLTEVVVQRSQGREFSPDRGRCEATPEQGLAPGDDVGSCERAKLVDAGDAGKGRKIPDVVLIRAPCFGIGKIRPPLGGGR